MAIRLAEWLTMARKTRRAPSAARAISSPRKGDLDAAGMGQSGRTGPITTPSTRARPTGWRSSIARRICGIRRGGCARLRSYSAPIRSASTTMKILKDQPHLGDYTVPGGREPDAPIPLLLPLRRRKGRPRRRTVRRIRQGPITAHPLGLPAPVDTTGKDLPVAMDRKSDLARRNLASARPEQFAEQVADHSR